MQSIIGKTVRGKIDRPIGRLYGLFLFVCDAHAFGDRQKNEEHMVACVFSGDH